MNPSLCKLSHVALVTPDIDRSLWFFRDLIGMEEVEQDGDRSYLRCAGELDHHSVSLREGPVGVEHIAFRVGGPDDLGLYAQQLRSDGLEVEEVARGEEVGQGEALRFTEPSSQLPLELVWEIDKPEADSAISSKLPTASTRFHRQGVAPRYLDHVNCQLAPPDIGAAEKFFTDRLGFKRREYVVAPDDSLMLSFLSVTPEVHDIALGPDVEGRSGRFHHLALTLESAAEILRAADIIREYDIEVDAWPGRHGIGQSYFFYIRDPGSGHRIELYHGGYKIYDPDWEPVRWTLDQLDYGVVFSGTPFELGVNGPMDQTTPGTCELAPVAS